VSEVFISYSRQDANDVNLLARKLEDSGHKVWLDRSAIQGGARWQEEIVRGIEKANVFLVVLSPPSIASEHVERELGLAHVIGKRILPVMLRRTAVSQPLQYALGSLEIIDISTEDIETASQRVVQAIASPDARIGIVYLDALWRDKLPSFWLAGYISLLILAFLQQRWNTEWAVPIGLLILVAVFTTVWAIRVFRRIYVDSCLNSRRIVLSTELKGFTKFRDRYRIASLWRDPETGKRYEFYSQRASFDRLKLVDRTVPVIVDRRNFKIYRMDLPALPKDASGSLAPSQPRELENDLRQLSPAGEGFARDIFLSHAEQDREAVGLLLQKLAAAGHAVWRPNKANETNVSYEEQAIDAISGARLFLLVLSPDSIASSRVRGELDLAVAKRKRILTAVLRRTTVPRDMDYALASVPHVDLSQDLETGVTGILDTIAAETPSATVVPETAAASRAAWLQPKLRLVLQFVGWIPVFMPLIAVLLVLKFLSLVLPVRLRPSRLEARCNRWLQLWDDILEGSDLRWLRPREKKSTSHLYESRDRARLLATEFETFEVKNDDRGRRLAIRIVSQWHDPVTQQRHRFRSHWLACEPEYIRTKIIPVYVDPTNLRRHSVDLSFLPEDQRREATKRAPLTRRLRNRLFRSRNPIAEEPSSAPPLLPDQEEIDSSRVFVSHSSENVDQARLLIERLERAGYEVVNRSENGATSPGEEESANRIILARTTVMVVPSAAASDLASKVLELRQAYTLNKRIIPVILSDYAIPPSMQLSLAGVQCVDLSPDFESGIRVLLSALPSRKSPHASAPDHPTKLSPLFGSPLRRLVSSVMMGAFSWALALTLSIVCFDRRSAMRGLLRIAPAVALAYGGVIGGIFHRRRMKPYGLFLTAFVSLVLFPVAVALFIPDHTINSGRDTWALMLTPVLGILAFITNKLIFVAIFNYRLKKGGKLILTEYKGSGMSQWRDPVTDEVHTFVRGYNGVFSKPIRATTIAVFMDPANPSDYYMDLSYRPQSKE
jgi:hypothetical protein